MEHKRVWVERFLFGHKVVKEYVGVMAVSANPENFYTLKEGEWFHSEEIPNGRLTGAELAPEEKIIK